MDNEIKGVGNSLNYKYRMHDPRLGRFFAIDPLTKKYPHYSPYSFSGNKVIAWRELEGAEEIITIWQKDGDTYKRTVFDGVQLTRKIYDNAGNQMDNSSISAEQYQALRKNYWNNLSQDNSNFAGSDKYKDNKEPPTTGNLIVIPSDNKTDYVYSAERIHKHKRMALYTPSLKESAKMGIKAANTIFLNPDPLVEGTTQSSQTFKNYVSMFAVIGGSTGILKISKLVTVYRVRKAFNIYSMGDTAYGVYTKIKDGDYTGAALTTIYGAFMSGQSALFTEKIMKGSKETYKLMTDIYFFLASKKIENDIQQEKENPIQNNTTTKKNNK